MGFISKLVGGAINEINALASASTQQTQSWSARLQQPASQTYAGGTLAYAQCPRSQPQPAQDWFVLNDARFPYFHVCPTCFHASIAITRLGAYFVAKPPAPPGAPLYALRCDFSLFWVRIAWSHLITTAKTDVTLLPRIAQVHSSVEACPNAWVQTEQQPRPLAARVWYTVGHPDNGMPLAGLSLCPSCVTHVATICSPIAQAFLPLAQTPTQGICDFVPATVFADQKTYAYLMKIEECATQAERTGQLDMRPFATLVLQNAPVGQPQTIAGANQQAGGTGICPRDVATAGLPVHTMPGVPDLTICEKCFHEVVAPAAARGEGLARTISPTPTVLQGGVGVTCQLYSARMRTAWNEASAMNNTEYLRQKVTERRAKEREYQMKIETLKAQARQLREQADVQQHMGVLQMRTAVNQASNNIMLSGIGATPYERDSFGHWRPATQADLTPSHSSMQQGTMMKFQAAQAEEEAERMKNEWRTYWE